MYITLSQFENNVSKYMKLATLIDITVVDLENGRSWIVSRGDFPEAKPVWSNLLSGLLQREKTPATGGVYV